MQLLHHPENQHGRKKRMPWPHRWILIISQLVRNRLLGRADGLALLMWMSEQAKVRSVLALVVQAGVVMLLSVDPMNVGVLASGKAVVLRLAVCSVGVSGQKTISWTSIAVWMSMEMRVWRASFVISEQLLMPLERRVSLVVTTGIDEIWLFENFTRYQCHPDHHQHPLIILGIQHEP
jgi:hypothetical protein